MDRDKDLMVNNKSERSDRWTLLQESLSTLEEMETRLHRYESEKVEPIAVVGMSCRFPGGANTPEAYWQLLCDGKDAIGEAPSNRWDARNYIATNPDSSGRKPAWYGGFLERIEDFDPQFFGISPREARYLDPQQRLLLEVTWEALERAGNIPGKLKGSATGVFIGITGTDFYQLSKLVGAEKMDIYTATGGALNAAAGRLSHLLGLQGPCMAVDTACSSSLVAIHLASQSLRAKESNLAIAGGVNMLLTPEPFIIFAKWGMMAPDGRCKTFDTRADGFVRSEGCGVVVLKRLSDAIADDDKIMAVIRGSAVNHDGRSSGFTVPNGLAQQKVVRKALEASGVKPNQVTYIEAHGTGTSLGDPIEIEALGKVLCEGRGKSEPLIVGSVKTNIGHLESAAGIAGLIKTILALQHEEIPPHLHFSEKSPRIPWPDFPVIVPTVRTLWPKVNGRRVAGVSSFGFSGTNAHVILEQAPERELVKADLDRPLHLLTLSAKSEKALQELAGRYKRYLADHPTTSLQDVCFTANVGRSHFGHRLALVGESSEQFRKKLSTLATSQLDAEIIRGVVPSAECKRVAFLFTGQGSQYVGMGRELYETQPTFRKVLDECDEILRAYLDKPLLSILYPEAGTTGDKEVLLNQTVYTQPALFALEYALAELWRSWGIEPSTVMGHSVGEYVAACIAGVFSLEAGLKLIAARGRLMQALPESGQMAAVYTHESRVITAIEPYADTVAIAAINGPENTVISGAGDSVRKVLEELEAEGVKAQRLNVSHAFHSPLMEPMLDEFEGVAALVSYSPPQTGLISNVTGQLIRNEELCQAAYWCRHLRSPVQFYKSIQTLAQRDYKVLIETGPHPVLLSMGSRCVPDDKGLWLPSLRKGRGDWQQMLETLGVLYIQGVEVDWAGFDRDYPRRRVLVPTYPFQRKRYWLEAPQGGHRKITAFQPERTEVPHPLLGYRLRSALKEILFENQISINRLPFLTDYRFYDTAVFPASGYLEMALTAETEMFSSHPADLEGVTFQEALVIPDDKVLTVHFILTPEHSKTASFQIFSLAEEKGDERSHWKLHASGQVHVGQNDSIAPGVLSLQSIRKRCQEELSGNTYYQYLNELGLDFGPEFHGLQHIWRRDGEALAEIRYQGEQERETHGLHLHAVLLESCFQLMTAAFSDRLRQGSEPGLYMPTGMASLRFYKRPNTQMWGYGLIREGEGGNNESIVGDVYLLNEAGQTVAEVKGLQFKRVQDEALSRLRQKFLADWLYEIDWEHKTPLEHGLNPIITQTRKPGRWLIFADQGGVGAALSQLLEDRGERCTMVFPGENFERFQNGDWKIAPERAEDIQRMLEEVLLAEGEELIGVVHLWALEALPPETGKVFSLNKTQVLTCGSTLHLVQALGKFVRPASPRLWLVTRGAQALRSETELVAVEQAPIWGLGRVIALECPEIWGGLVDLDPGINEAEVPMLLDELSTPKEEDLVGFRGKERFVARLRRSRVRNCSRPSLSLQGDGTYLITGGLGGLGLIVARWLVEQGARRLVLVGRSGASSAAQRTIDELEQTGAKVTTARADVSKREQIAGVFAKISSSMPPLRGVIHAAGVVDDGILFEQDWLRFTEVMAPKVQGAWNLHALTLDLDLDFFVLFSSAASLIGSAGQGNYAAANAFLDGLTHYRRAIGLPSLCINWGAWAGVGMTRKLGNRDAERRAEMGLSDIQPLHGARILAELMNSEYIQTAVLPIKWQTFFRKFQQGDVPILLSKIFEEMPSGEEAHQGGDGSEASSLLNDIFQAPAKARPDLVSDHIRQQVIKVLRLDRSQPVDFHKGLTEIGMDSLMAVELRNLLQVDFKNPIPTSVMFECPTISELSSYIVDEFFSDGTVAEPSHDPGKAEEQSYHDKILMEMSEDEAEETLISELNRRGF